MSAWITLLLLLAGGAALTLGLDTARWVGLEPGEFALTCTGLALFVLGVAALAGSYKGRTGRAVRDGLATVLLMVGLLGAYSFRDELTALAFRIAGEFGPQNGGGRGETVAEGERAVRIRKRNDGHFLARVQANGSTLTMLVDTGASTVVLNPADAKRIGIDLDKLRYSVPVQTANGTTYAAQVRLKSVSVGGIVMRDIEALVAKPGTLRDSLLGMSFLSRLRSYEFSGEYLTLRI